MSPATPADAAPAHPAAMTPERWERVHRLFSDALDRDPGERDAFVAAACAGDPALHREVASLLAAADRTGDFLDGPAVPPPPAGADGPAAGAPAAPVARLAAALAGRYAVERELGRGGMATVYLARDLKHRRPVALKVLHPALAASLSAERFLREIETAANLSHPHVLELYDSGEADGLLYYAMPYVDGESLRDRLRRLAAAGERLPRDEAVRVACELARALGYAHRRGVVHRDVKPENVLLDESGHARLADFGIARPAGPRTGDDLTRGGAAIGTARYMSPEQAAGQAVDGRSDLYALGCVLREMLGERPGADAPAARAPADAALARVVATATAWAAADRYADARAFEEALAQAAAPNGAPARRRWPRRARAALAGAAAAGAALLVWRAAVARAPLDRNRVAVYPLTVSGVGGSRAAGEDVATAIGSALDRAGPLRWIDGWRLLDPGRRDDGRRLPSEVTGSLARSKGCAYYVTGRVVYSGDSADVFLELVDAAGDSVVGRGHAGGLARESWRVGLRAVNALLPALVPDGNARDLAAGWADREPGAVATFLAGEAAFRRARPAEALTHYRAAVARDPGFGLAAVRGAQAATWIHREGEAATLVALALRQPLARRDAHFARGYAAYLEGRADSAAAELGRAVRLDPDMAAAWVQLGEVHTHLLPAAGGDADSLAARAFETARRLDGGTAHLYHLIEVYERRGDTARAAPLVREFLAARPDPTLAEQVRTADACVRRGPASVDWPAAVARDPLAVLSVGKALAGGGAQLACAEAAFAAVLRADTTAGPEPTARRRRGLVGLQAALLARGRLAEARAQIEGSIRSGLGGSTLFLLGSVVTPGFAARAEAVAAADAVVFGPAYERCPYPLRLWYLGVWAAHAGRADLAEAVHRRLDRHARAGGEPFDALLAHSVGALVPVARGDTAEAVRRLSAALAEPARGDDLAWEEAAPRAVERLALARLLLARGDPARALAVAGALDAASPYIHLLFIPESLALRADAAAALGQHAAAARFRSRLAALRGGARVAAQ